MKEADSNWERIKEVVWQALELEPEGRPVFVREACAGDAELLREVESLLAAADDSLPLLENRKYNVAAVFAPATEADRVDLAAGNKYQGKTFGRYAILREIGRGGMGTVFLAERSDGEFDQQVALKIVRQTIVDAEIERRFRRERQILASLHHPNIAALLDGGVGGEGEPFLVMEYVDGESLLDYAEKRELPVDERLALFLKVCAAVSFAHRRLVIHRDLKPSNILVTAEGETKLLDFGLAKILSDNIHNSIADGSETATAYRAFTLAYASPEQIRGEQVTTASDVYSLGVVLYELLTGERPFHYEKQSYQEVLLGLASTLPPKPSEITQRNNSKTSGEKSSGIRAINPQALSSDIDNIVLKALRKEPEQRYTSVEQLAEDIRRHKAGLPVNARPHTFGYRASKFLRRNKAAVVAALLITLSLITGTTVSIWQATAAKKERDRAEKRFNDVRKLSNSLLFELSPKIEHLEGSTEARSILVTRALEYLDSLAQESQDDTGLQSELASAYEKIGDLQGNPTNPNLGELDKAIESYEKAARIRAALVAQNPGNVQFQRLLAANYRATGDLHWQASAVDESLKDANAALDLYNKLLLDQPPDAEIKLGLAQTTYDIGFSLSSNGKYSDAIPYFQKSLAAAEEISGQLPGNLSALILLGNSHTQLGNALSWDNRQAEGEVEMAKARAVYEPLVAANPDNMRLRNGLWLAYRLTSSVYEDQDDQLSYEYAQKSLKIMQENAERDPSNLRAKEQLANSYSSLGTRASRIGKPAEAITSLEQAAAVLQKLAQIDARNGKYLYNIGLTLNRLGTAKYAQGDIPGALAALNQASETLTALSQNGTATNSARLVLAKNLEQTGDIYTRLSGKSPGAHNQAYLQNRDENYCRALVLYQQLSEQNALPKSDQKSLEEMQCKVQSKDSAKCKVQSAEFDR